MKELLKGTGAARILSGEVRRGRENHAYLLVFEDGKYLRFALRTFAAILYGGDARKTSLIERESFADCKMCPREGEKLSAEDAADIVSESVIRPLEGEKKLFVIDGFQTANAATQNKLLKVLEEPPQGVCFLLGATGVHAILPTVLSRVTRLEIPRFSQEQTERFLARKYPESSPAQRRESAAISGGVPSVAEEFLGGGEYAECLALALRAAECERGEFPEVALKAAALGAKESFLAVWKAVYRDMLARLLGQDAVLLRGAKRNGHTAASLVAAIDLISEAENEVKLNANYRQAVEILLARIEKEKTRW